MSFTPISIRMRFYNLRISKVIQENNDAAIRTTEIKKATSSRANSYKSMNNKSKCFRCNRFEHWHSPTDGSVTYVTENLIIKENNVQIIIHAHLKDTRGLPTEMLNYMDYQPNGTKHLGVKIIKIEVQSKLKGIHFDSKVTIEEEAIYEVQEITQQLEELNMM